MALAACYWLVLLRARSQRCTASQRARKRGPISLCEASEKAIARFLISSLLVVVGPRRHAGPLLLLAAARTRVMRHETPILRSLRSPPPRSSFAYSQRAFLLPGAVCISWSRSCASSRGRVSKGLNQGPSREPELVRVALKCVWRARALVVVRLSRESLTRASQTS